jgi:LacI family transcriptional regulator
MKNGSKKISMKDIARELNISITTVSFVVNGKSEQKNISAATVKKVKNLIEKRGFKPNSVARMLRTGKSKTIGLIVEDISNYFFGSVAKIIEREAHKNGYNIFFSSTENNFNTARELIAKMKNSAVDGFVITATKGLRSEIIKLKKENIPFVLIDRLVPGIKANYVILDNYRGAVELTKHLLRNGYSSIGFISIISDMSQMMDRKRGVVDALKDAHINIARQAMLEIPFGETNEYIINAIKDFITANPDLDALFFATNYLGVFGIEALQRNNLKIPADIAVVCFDDNDIFRLLTPSITVAAQPIDEIATHSIELLLRMINNDGEQSESIGTIISPTIIVRGSSPPKTGAKMVG